MEIVQPIDQPVDISHWKREDPYPEGARDKSLIFCPTPSNYDFLDAGQGYLFKLSSKNYPEQFWAEILAYYVGIQMQVSVPPTFVAFDDRNNQTGALIKWFLDESSSNAEEYQSGSDYCGRYILDFDHKKGTKHNFETVAQIFTENFNQIDWRNDWAKIFAFDSLIGNTDRHQKNWGIIISVKNGVRIAPAFDNGTSMGHEILPEKFDTKNIEKYVSDGTHHMRWKLDTLRIEHCEFLKRIIQQYPETVETIRNCLRRLDYEFFEKTLDFLTQFDVPVKLTKDRAKFMLKLLEFRYKRLLNLLSELGL
ncbi:MAG: HipA domain-containing protein [Proteobacteria bacterium]|nr:HipA domain-containing protein [Pseudomonadota bacterium]